MTDHRNVVRQNYFRDIGDVMLVRNLFRLIRVINRTNSRPIWTPTCEDIDHNAKITSFTLPKKNPQGVTFSIGCQHFSIQSVTHKKFRIRDSRSDTHRVLFKKKLGFEIQEVTPYGCHWFSSGVTFLSNLGAFLDLGCHFVPVGCHSKIISDSRFEK